MRNLRSGFSMFVAIFTIVLMSFVATYIFYSSNSIAKEGAIQYKQNQAEILARSYTEYAVMAIGANSRNTNCINKIDATIGTNPATGNGYKVEVYVTYIGNSKYINKCSKKAAVLADTDIDTLSVILDVYVRYRDYQNSSLYNGFSKYAPWQTYHKRSLQKI